MYLGSIKQSFHISLLAGGYWGYHRGKPVRSLIGHHLGFWGAFSFRASRPPPPRRLFVNYRLDRSSASRIMQNGGHEKRTPGFLAEEKLQRLQVGYFHMCPQVLFKKRYYLRNRKHVPCFYRVIQTRVKVWENEKCCGNTSRRRVFPQLFRVLPNFHECLYNSIETRGTCFLFLLENNATRKRKTTC